MKVAFGVGTQKARRKSCGTLPEAQKLQSQLEIFKKRLEEQ